MLGVNPEIGSLPLHLWVAVGSAVLLVALCTAAIFRTVPALRVEVLALGALLGAAMAWAVLDRQAASDRRAEEQALEARAGDLSARTLAPGSPLGCLDALAGDSVEAACEKAIFASPASVAAATSYVAARLALLTEMTAFVRRGGTDIDNVLLLLLPLRRALEADRFGLLAHLLVVRDGCTRENCDALTLLHDAERVRAHLSEATLDQLVAQYSTAWAQPTEALADAQPRAAAGAQAAVQPSHKPVNIDFPTAASIPPISIMTPEPKGPVLPGVAAAAAANPNPQPASPSARRGHKQQAAPAPHPAVQAAAPATGVEPIWPEPVPPPPAAPQPAPAPPAAATQPAAAAAAEAPARLNPFPSPPEASAGMTVGAQ